MADVLSYQEPGAELEIVKSPSLQSRGGPPTPKEDMGGMPSSDHAWGGSLFYVELEGLVVVKLKKEN